MKTIFHVGYVGYTNRCIAKLIIQDENNIVRWYCGMTEQEVLEWMNEQKEVYGYSEPAPKSEEEKTKILMSKTICLSTIATGSNLGGRR